MSINCRRLLMFITVFVFSCHAFEVVHQSSFPYIAGDTFRAFSNHILDHSQTFEPARVRAGDIVFVQVDLLSHFFNVLHQKIASPYILLTHNCDDQSDDPVPGRFKGYLDDPKLAAWFTQNMDTHHPKLYALPIGLANHYYPHGNTTLYDHYRICCKDHVRDKLLYMNFQVGTYPEERKKVYSLFKNQPFCTVRNDVSVDQYLNDTTHHRFVLSPRGHGLDCHRTWEALLMGAYPIVKTSTLDVLYEDLPVVIVKDWSEVTEEFLQQKYEEMQQKTYRMEKLFAPYWFNEIRKVQKIVRLDDKSFGRTLISSFESKQEKALRLIEHVKQSIHNAENGISKLNASVLHLEGFSSAKGRHLLNNLCALNDTHYLEIGVWKGSTFVSALYGNEQSVAEAIAIDNWSELNEDKTGKATFDFVVSNYLKYNYFRLYNENCFAIDKSLAFKNPVTMYFYDGNHDYGSQRKAFTYFNDCLDDIFIAVVDDYNWCKVQGGTRRAFVELDYQILFERFLKPDQLNDSHSWWNGLYVAVVSKMPLDQVRTVHHTEEHSCIQM